MLLLFLLAAMSAQSEGIPHWIMNHLSTNQPSYPEEATNVILFYQTEVHVTKRGALLEHHKQIVKVLKKEDESARVEMIHFEQGEKIKQFNAYHINALNQVVENQSREKLVYSTIYTENDYDDAKQAISAFQDVDEGHILAYDYIIERKPLLNNYIFTFQPTRMPVLFSRFILNVPKGWTYQYFIPKFKNQVKAEIAPNRGVWTCIDLHFQAPESYSPPFYYSKCMLYLNFTPPRQSAADIASWHDFAYFMRRLWYKKTIAGDRIAETVQVFQSSETNVSGCITRAADFIQKKIRYISIQMGIGGFEPQSAISTFNNRYGDCKAHSALFISIMTELGLKAFPVFVCTKNDGHVYQQFPFSYFNHVIVAIDLNSSVEILSKFADSAARTDRFLIFDPTAEKVPIGQVPSSLQGTHGFIIEPDTAYFIKIPKHPLSLETSRRCIKLQLSENGDIVMNYHLLATGSEAASHRYYWAAMSPNEQKLALFQQWSDNFFGLKIDSLELFNLDNVEKPFSMKYKLLAQNYNYASMQDSLLAFKPYIFSTTKFQPLPSKAREKDIYLGRPYCQVDSIRFEFPPTWRIKELPIDQKKQLLDLYFKVCYDVSGNAINIVRRYKKGNDLISKDNYTQFRDFLIQIYAADQARILLERQKL